MTCERSNISKRHTCPSDNAKSFKICIECQACKPGLSPQIQELSEANFNVCGPQQSITDMRARGAFRQVCEVEENLSVEGS